MSIQKRNNTWQYTIELGIIDGKRKRITKSGFPTKKACESEYAIMLGKYKRTGNVKLPSDISFIDYLNIYIDEYVNNSCRESTIRTYMSRIEKVIVPYYGNYRLRDITSATVYEHLVELYKKGYSKNYVYSVKSLLYNMFSFAIFPKELIDNNPVASINIKRLNFDNRSLPELNIEKLLRIIDFMNQDLKRSFYVFPLKMIYYTGLRKSELLGLTLDDIDMTNRVITVNKQKIYDSRGNSFITAPKTQAGNRKIYFDDALYDILRAQIRTYNELGLTHNYICFKSDCTPITKYNMDVIGSTINRNVCDFTWHAVRHHHATTLIEAGVSPKSVADRLGHESTKTTMDTYVSMTDKLARESLGKMKKL